MKKVYKEVETDDGKITFYGSNKHIRVDYHIKPEWSEEPEMSFRYNGHRYFISEFMAFCYYVPDFMKEFDGYLNDSFFSGIVIKLCENENGEDTVKAFTFIS